MSRPATPPTPDPKKVRCADCRHFVRDTTGLSRRNGTGEYFMGVSDIGCDPDRTYNKKTGTAKIFADKERYCTQWRRR